MVEVGGRESGMRAGDLSPAVAFVCAVCGGRAGILVQLHFVFVDIHR